MPSPSLFLNDFTVIDFAFVGEEGGVLGESFFVSAELFGELDEKDFLLDFSAAKKTLKALVDDSFDHKLLVPMGSGKAKVFEGGLEIEDSAKGMAWRYDCPRQAFEVFPDKTIDAEVLAYHLSRLSKAVLPANVAEARFTFRSPSHLEREASFRYTHGLRFHEGNCQRLFHGHRNPVEVWLDGRRAPEWEARLAAEWNHAHFVSVPTLKNLRELDLSLGERSPGHPGMAELGFVSGQGPFSARMPASRLVLVEEEPSIETMAKLAVSRLRKWGLAGAVRVVAYEGLNKGASFSD